MPHYTKYIKSLRFVLAF